MSRAPSWLAAPPPDAAVELTADRVSAAMLGSRGSGLAVTAHATVALPPGAVTPSFTHANIADPAAVTAALRELFARLGSRPRRIGLLLPDTVGKVSLLRFETVPARADDLDQLIRWQLRKSAPFPVEEAQVSWTAGVPLPDGGREFIVVLARRAVVAEYEAVCAAAGASAGLVDLATLNLLNLVMASPGAPAGDWLLVHVTADSTSVAIARGSDLVFFRNRPEHEGESLTDLVHQTRMYYEDRLEGRGLTRALLAGASGAVTGADALRREVEERLGTPVEALDPRGAVALTDRIIAAPELLDTLAPLVGLLLRSRAA